MFKCQPSAAVHPQHWHRTERHTVWIVANGISLMAYSIWSLSSSCVCSFVAYTENIASMPTFGDHPKTCTTASALSLSVGLLYFPDRPFNTSCTVPSTSNLSRILIIVTLVGGGLPNSTLQRCWTSTFTTFRIEWETILQLANRGHFSYAKLSIWLR